MVYYLIVINIYTFLIFIIDKFKSIKGSYRISEAHLLISSFIGGIFGGILGMYIIRHKTKKPKFQILMPLMLIIWIYLIIKYGNTIFFNYPQIIRIHLI